MSFLRQGKLTSDPLNTAPSSSYVAIDLLYHISSFSRVLAAADVLDTVGSAVEKAAFAELKNLTLTMMSSVQNEAINMQPFLDKLSSWTNVDYSKVEHNDILSVWDDIVKLIMVVVPPLREVFLGQVSSNLEVPGWLNLMSRCFHAHFTESAMSLEEVYLNSLTSSPSTSSLTNVTSNSESTSDDQAAAVITNNTATAGDKLRIANAMVLRRAPEILVVSVDSVHLSSQYAASLTGSVIKGPTAIRYPETFDLGLFSPSSSTSTVNGNHSEDATKMYDLSTVAVLEGPSLDSLQTYFRITSEEHEERWYKGAGYIFEEVSKRGVVEGNFYGGTLEKRVHPRLLIYTRRDLPQVLERTLHLVSKAGQMRALGDAAFAAAMTTENYGDARRCYEEAIALDESLRTALQENLSSLEKIERTQRARVLEEQADLALANKRFREASELYSKGMMNAVVSSGVYLRVRDKLESVTHIIALDSACQFAEKGEEALLLGLLPNAKDLYSQAFKLNPEFLHLHTILVGIDKTVQMQTAGQRIADALTASKAHHYKLANHFYREAIALVPEKLAELQSTLDILTTLMQGEDALMRQKSGLAALEDKRYTAAIQLFTEAIGLLPEAQTTRLAHAVFLCDRALAHYDLKDFHTSLIDCTAALALKPELAVAHFRLGAAQFSLDQFDLASASYDRALKCDPAMCESIKVKVRQVATAREIQQRKQREAERAKAKEEEKKLLDEKRVRDELIKKERAEKLALEQAEKAERNRIKEEERKAKAAKEKGLEKEKEKEKEAEKERLRLEKLERDVQKVADRERAKLEKEKERERIRTEKEQKVNDCRRLQEEEKQRQLEFTAELERGAARQREVEREKEIEKERARIERERVVAEREKVRREKLEAEASKAIADAGLSKAANLIINSNAAAVSSTSVYTPLEPQMTHMAVSVSAPAAANATVVSASKKEQGQVAGDSEHLRWSVLASSALSSKVPSSFSNSSNITSLSAEQLGAKSSTQSSDDAFLGNGKVWTASKSSADTITRLPSAVTGTVTGLIGVPSINPKMQASATDSLAEFPILGETAQPARSLSVSVDVITNEVDDEQELGWSVRRSSLQKDLETFTPTSLSSSASILSSNDIFSSMAERPAMSTDYTFKPSEKTIRAAEAKRLADSQQKAAAAAAAVSSLPSASKGDFDEFLSNSSASYISNFSSSIRYNQNDTANTVSSLYFPPTSPSSAHLPLNPTSSSSRLPVTYNDPSTLGTAFSSSFSGLGFASSFLSSTASSSGELGGLRSNLAQTNLRQNPHTSLSAGNGILDEEDDFSNGYFNNSLSTLGGLDLDDATDLLLLAMGDLGMAPNKQPLLPSNLAAPVAQSPLRVVASNHSISQHQSQGQKQGQNLPIPAFSIPTSSSRSKQYGYAANTINPTSSLHQLNIDYSPLPSPPMTYFNDSNQNQKQELNTSPFQSLSSLGGHSNNINGFDSFSAPATNGINGDFPREYFNGGQRQGASIGTGTRTGTATFGVQQSQLQPSTMFTSPFRTQTGHNLSKSDAGDNLLQHTVMHTDQEHSSINAHLPLNFPPSAPSSSSAPLSVTGQEGIEADMLPESAFYSVAWLRQHDMHMYRWAGDASEWTEYAMHLPAKIAPFFSTGPSPYISVMSELQTSGCKMWVDKETLLGREATFLVFLRGAAGQPSNACMNTALDILSSTMKILLPQIALQSQLQPFGSIGSNRLSPFSPPPPPPHLVPSAMGVLFPSTQPSAWGAAGLSTTSTGAVGGNGDEEDQSIMSDEYYDPEDLARSLSLLEGTDASDSEWCTVSTKRFTTSVSSIRPEPLRVQTLTGGYVQRWLEIPRDSVGLVIGQGGKKIKDLCALSGAKIQFRVNKTAEREGRPGLLELHGGADNVDQGLQLVWDLLHLLGKEYQEVPVQKLK